MNSRVVGAALSLLCVSALAYSAHADSPQVEVKVTVTGFEFKPEEVTVKKGGSVIFTNLDSAPHNVAPDKGANFEKCERMLKDQSQTIIFNNTGDQHYFCEIHPGMKGVVKVVE